MSLSILILRPPWFSMVANYVLHIPLVRFLTFFLSHINFKLIRSTFSSFLMQTDGITKFSYALQGHWEGEGSKMQSSLKGSCCSLGERDTNNNLVHRKPRASVQMWICFTPEPFYLPHLSWFRMFPWNNSASIKSPVSLIISNKNNLSTLILII